jgi:RNA polymerase sigma factor (sigma-70 family)
MSEEAELFAEFSATRSEAAFAGIIRLHTKLVFATALRQLGDRGLAEEVTQSVFIALSQKATSLNLDRTVAGWLYQTTINQARQRLRAELRRRNREQIAAAVTASSQEGDSLWAMLIPLLDEALLSLSEKDRLAVVLHYMEQRTFGEVGEVLGVGEDAARKRVNRVVANLISWFRKRGVTVPGTSMIATLSLEGVNAAPISAAAILATSTGTAAFTGATLSSLAILMTSTQIKLTVALLALGVGLTTHFVLRNRTAASDTPAQAQDDVGAERPGEPRIAKATAGLQPQAPIQPRPDAGPAKSFLERLNDGDMSLSMLSREEADQFLALNKTNAQSLLAAFRVTHDIEYLRQAATNYPNDPSVLFRAVAHDAFPENRRSWLDQLKQADPENALAHYLSANQHWKDNDLRSAFQDLAQAAQKTGFQDYVTDHMQSLEEIYLSAGRTPAEAKALATHAVEMPHISQLSEMSKGMADLLKQYLNNGDSASVENLARMGLSIAGHLNGVQDGGNLLGQIVGVKVEQRILGQLDPNQRYAFLAGTVPERLGALDIREQSIRQDSQFVGQWIPRASAQEQMSYFDRLKLYGESAAIDWLRNRSQ